MPRILSISGLRGTIGDADGLDPVFAMEFAAAVGTLAGGGIFVVSRDGRSTGIMLKSAVVAGLTSVGCDVVDADIATTPTCGVLITELKAAGGLQITASHNPIEWNGLKPFTAGGSVFDAETGKKLLAILESKKFNYRKHDAIGKVTTLDDPFQAHLDRVFKLVNVDAIKAKNFRVVLDCNHGSGGLAGPRLLEALGCEVIVLGGTPDGKFEHIPEPLAENLTELAAKVKVLRANVGFAQDPDADRLAIVDETGHYIGEELTLALAVDHVLSTAGQASSATRSVVVNGSTSRVTADLAAKYGSPFFRSAVGEANVVSMMKEKHSTIGGEGNGGVIEPQVGYVRDSLVSMAYVLDGLAKRGGTLSKWVSELPKYTIVKKKVTCPASFVAPACEALSKTYSDATATTGDGLRLDWPNKWVQIRASNTEPIVRVIAEAATQAEANSLADDAMEVVQNVILKTS